MTEEQAFTELLQKIRELVKYDCTGYKEKCLRRRLAVRMRAKEVETYTKYLHILKNDPQEYKLLERVLTINVSRFFRNKPVFDVIFNDLMPQLLARKRREKIRNLSFWSAGCATGEEPYTIVMGLKEFYPYVFNRYKVNIYGTDIDEESLRRARKGIYEDISMEEMPVELIPKYFDGERPYQLKKEIISKVIFQKLDLVHDSPIQNCDLILCRNVLIYFSRPLQEKVFNKLVAEVLAGGYIVLGKTETTIGFSVDPSIVAVNLRERIYQRRDSKWGK